MKNTFRFSLRLAIAAIAIAMVGCDDNKTAPVQRADFSGVIGGTCSQDGFKEQIVCKDATTDPKNQVYSLIWELMLDGKVISTTKGTLGKQTFLQAKEAGSYVVNQVLHDGEGDELASTQHGVTVNFRSTLTSIGLAAEAATAELRFGYIEGSWSGPGTKLDLLIKAIPPSTAKAHGLEWKSGTNPHDYVWLVNEWVFQAEKGEMGWYPPPRESDRR